MRPRPFAPPKPLEQAASEAIRLMVVMDFMVWNGFIRPPVMLNKVECSRMLCQVRMLSSVTVLSSQENTV